MQSHNVWIRGALSGARELGHPRGRRALRLPADVQLGGLGGAHLPRARRGHPGRPRSGVLGADVLGPHPTLRCDADLHARHDAHLPLAGARARRRRAQPGAPRGLRADARSTDRPVQEALRHRDARPGLRPERGARHAAPLRRHAAQAELARPAAAGHRGDAARRRRPAGRGRRGRRVLLPPDRAQHALLGLLEQPRGHRRCVAQPLVPHRRPRPARRGRRLVLRRPQEGLHPPQGPQHVVVRGGARVHGPPRGLRGGGDRHPRPGPAERSRADGVREAQGREQRGRPPSSRAS